MTEPWTPRYFAVVVTLALVMVGSVGYGVGYRHGKARVEVEAPTSTGYWPDHRGPVVAPAQVVRPEWCMLTLQNAWTPSVESFTFRPRDDGRCYAADVIGALVSPGRAVTTVVAVKPWVGEWHCDSAEAVRSHQISPKSITIIPSCWRGYQ